MTTKTTTTETLEERAARIAVESAEVRAEQHRRARAEAERLAASQTAFDAEVIASYDRQALEAEVTQARQAVDQAIAEHPLTKLLTAYYTAGSKRHEVFSQYIGALARQGRDVSSVQYPRTDAIDLPELINRIAQTAASDWRIQAEADFHQRRNTSQETK